MKFYSTLTLPPYSQAKYTEVEQRRIDLMEEARGLKETVGKLTGENSGLERLRAELARLVDERDAEVDDLRAELDETIASNQALAVEVEASREEASRAMSSLEEVSEQLSRMYDGPAGASVVDQVVEVKGNLERLRVQCNEEKSSSGDKDDELETLRRLTQSRGVKILGWCMGRAQQKGAARAMNVWKQFAHMHAVGNSTEQARQLESTLARLGSLESAHNEEKEALRKEKDSLVMAHAKERETLLIDLSRGSQGDCVRRIVGAVVTAHRRTMQQVVGKWRDMVRAQTILEEKQVGSQTGYPKFYPKFY